MAELTGNLARTLEETLLREQGEERVAVKVVGKKKKSPPTRVPVRLTRKNRPSMLNVLGPPPGASMYALPDTLPHGGEEGKDVCDGNPYARYAALSLMMRGRRRLDKALQLAAASRGFFQRARLDKPEVFFGPDAADPRDVAFNQSKQVLLTTPIDYTKLVKRTTVEGGIATEEGQFQFKREDTPGHWVTTFRSFLLRKPSGPTSSKDNMTVLQKCLANLKRGWPLVCQMDSAPTVSVNENLVNFYRPTPGHRCSSWELFEGYRLVRLAEFFPLPPLIFVARRITATYDWENIFYDETQQPLTIQDKNLWIDILENNRDYVPLIPLSEHRIYRIWSNRVQIPTEGFLRVNQGAQKMGRDDTHEPVQDLRWYEITEPTPAGPQATGRFALQFFLEGQEYTTEDDDAPMLYVRPNPDRVAEDTAYTEIVGTRRMLPNRLKISSYAHAAWEKCGQWNPNGQGARSYEQTDETVAFAAFQGLITALQAPAAELHQDTPFSTALPTLHRALGSDRLPFVERNEAGFPKAWIDLTSAIHRQIVAAPDCAQGLDEEVIDDATLRRVGGYNPPKPSLGERVQGLVGLSDRTKQCLNLAEEVDFDLQDFFPPSQAWFPTPGLQNLQPETEAEVLQPPAGETAEGEGEFGFLQPGEIRSPPFTDLQTLEQRLFSEQSPESFFANPSRAFVTGEGPAGELISALLGAEGRGQPAFADAPPSRRRPAPSSKSSGDVGDPSQRSAASAVSAAPATATPPPPVAWIGELVPWYSEVPFPWDGDSSWVPYLPYKLPLYNRNNLEERFTFWPTEIPTLQQMLEPAPAEWPVDPPTARQLLEAALEEWRTPDGTFPNSLDVLADAKLASPDQLPDFQQLLQLAQAANPEGAPATLAPMLEAARRAWPAGFFRSEEEFQQLLQRTWFGVAEAWRTGNTFDILLAAQRAVSVPLDALQILPSMHTKKERSVASFGKLLKVHPSKSPKKGCDVDEEPGYAAAAELFAKQGEDREIAILQLAYPPTLPSENVQNADRGRPKIRVQAGTVAAAYWEAFRQHATAAFLAGNSLEAQKRKLAGMPEEQAATPQTQSVHQKARAAALAAKTFKGQKLRELVSRQFRYGVYNRLLQHALYNKGILTDWHQAHIYKSEEPAPDRPDLPSATWPVFLRSANDRGGFVDTLQPENSTRAFYPLRYVRVPNMPGQSILGFPDPQTGELSTAVQLVTPERYIFQRLPPGTPKPKLDALFGYERLIRVNGKVERVTCTPGRLYEDGLPDTRYETWLQTAGVHDLVFSSYDLVWTNFHEPYGNDTYGLDFASPEVHDASNLTVAELNGTQPVERDVPAALVLPPVAPSNVQALAEEERFEEVPLPRTPPPSASRPPTPE